jgi:hypothetical protein
MTVADDRLAEVGAWLDAWNFETARDLLSSLHGSPAHVREEHVLRHACAPGMS